MIKSCKTSFEILPGHIAQSMHNVFGTDNSKVTNGETCQTGKSLISFVLFGKRGNRCREGLMS